MEKRQYKQGQVRALPGDDSRTVRFTISNGSVDRHKSVIPTEAWDLESFKENPIAGWGHAVYGGWQTPDPDDIIGRWDVWIEDKELVGDLTFEDKEVNPKADKLFKKVKNGTLNAVSVGFISHKLHNGDPEKKESEQEGIIYYDEVELVEVSLVVIASNKTALKKALENGDIPELIEEMVREALGDEYREDLTLKGLFAVLRGGDAGEVEEAETGEEVDTQSREAHLQKVKAYNEYIEKEEKFNQELLKTER